MTGYIEPGTLKVDFFAEQSFSVVQMFIDELKAI